jgi:hypothetical protein
MSRLVGLYAIGRAAFGAASLLAPRATGEVLAGDGGAAPDAQAFLRGMGGRELGLVTGMLASRRAGHSPVPWLVAGVLSDCGDIIGIVGAWDEMAPEKRGPGLAFGVFAACVGAALAIDCARS